MNIEFRSYNNENLEKMRMMWNDIIEDGVAFPGTDILSKEIFNQMISQQDAVNCMYVDKILAGYYILHPNNIGRCSHVANASYVLDKTMRGKHLGKYLVEHSIKTAKELDFRGMQFNAVVESNKPALHIYKSLGFKEVGMIPQGFMLKDGSYSNMYILYLSLL